MKRGPLRVAFVHERFPPDYAGGGEYVVYQMAKHLQEAGVEVTVITTGDPNIGEFDGIRTIRKNCSVYAFNLQSAFVEKWALGADVIQSFTYHGIWPAYRAAKGLGLPLVRMMLALFGPEWQVMKGRWLGKGFAWMERKLIELPADKHIYISDFSKSYASRLGFLMDRTTVIEPGISLDDYSFGNKSYVMFSGKLSPRKGVAQVMAAAERLPHIKFVITGWGEDHSSTVFSKCGNVRFVPFQDRLALAKLLAEAKIFVFPTRVETFGLAVAEAMASGCAVVSSSELPFAGVKVNAEDTEGIIDAIRRLVDDDQWCRRCGIENQQAAAAYNWERHTRSLLRIYEELLTERTAQNNGN